MINPPIDSSLTKLDIDSNIVRKLNTNNIFIIKELWILKRKNLKDLGLTDEEIKHITIKLQLNSMDLNKKIYSKNWYEKVTVHIIFFNR